MNKSVGHWSRFLGVSLRPWSGHAPSSLIIRGLISVTVCGFVLTFLLRGFFGMGAAIHEQDLAMLRGLVLPMMIAVIVLLLIGVFRILIGVLDLVPRKSISGVVLSVRERKVGDFLPILAQRLIFERNENNIDRRRTRIEVVLLTENGEHQWTVRDRSKEQALKVGVRVRMRVTPLAGYVAHIETLPQSSTQTASLG